MLRQCTCASIYSYHSVHVLQYIATILHMCFNIYSYHMVLHFIRIIIATLCLCSYLAAAYDMYNTYTSASSNNCMHGPSIKSSPWGLN